MNNRSPDARAGNPPDLSFLDEQRLGARVVCDKGDYNGITFVTANAIGQALVNAKAEHDLPGHNFTVEQVSLR